MKIMRLAGRGFSPERISQSFSNARVLMDSSLMGRLALFRRQHCWGCSPEIAACCEEVQDHA